MKYLLIIHGKLNNLNDYIKAMNRSRYEGSDLKSKNEAKVMQEIYSQFGRLRITKPVRMQYTWYEPNKQRDKDNISSFGRKVIQDALVKTKVLQNDGWKNVIGFSDEFDVDTKNPRIEVLIEEE